MSAARRRSAWHGWAALAAAYLLLAGLVTACLQWGRPDLAMAAMGAFLGAFLVSRRLYR